jgi:hypothetical protein
MSIIKLLFYTSIMDTQANIQKRKRADTALNEHAFECSIEGEPTIIVDTSRHWLPSNIEYDSEIQMLINLMTNLLRNQLYSSLYSLFSACKRVTRYAWECPLLRTIHSKTHQRSFVRYLLFNQFVI